MAERTLEPPQLGFLVGKTVQGFVASHEKDANMYNIVLVFSDGTRLLIQESDTIFSHTLQVEARSQADTQWFGAWCVADKYPNA